MRTLIDIETALMTAKSLVIASFICCEHELPAGDERLAVCTVIDAARRQIDEAVDAFAELRRGSGRITGI